MFGITSGRPKFLVLIRHAESMRNKAKMGATYFADEEARRFIKGIPDQNIDITKLGEEQAQAAGIYLKEKFGVPNYVYDSGYLRTVRTADLALQAYNPEELTKINRRSSYLVRERDPGYTYEMTTEEAEANFPYLKEYWNTVGGFFAAPPGGESLAKATERVQTFLNMIFRDRDDQTVFVFTHGGTKRCFRFILEHWNYKKFLEEPGPNNCGITVYKQEIVDAKNSTRKRLILDEYDNIKWRTAHG